MPWARLDDKFWRNPKMQALSHAARGAWANSVSYCADTPDPTGFLTFKEARERGTKALVTELVAGGAFEPVNGGYLIHDFDKYLHRGSRDRCRKWREKKRLEGVTGDVTDASPDRHSDVTSRDGSGDNKNVRVLPGPDPVPDSDGVKTPKRLEMPRRGFRGGEMTNLLDSLPKVRA